MLKEINFRVFFNFHFGFFWGAMCLFFRAKLSTGVIWKAANSIELKVGYCMLFY